jgi:hypothetical protein
MVVLAICMMLPSLELYAQSGPFLINEIAPINDHIPDEYGEFDDWIEIYNSSESPVWIDDIYLTDDFDEPLKWKIDGPHKMQPGSFLIIWMDGQSLQGVFHAPFKLKFEGEQVAITQIIGSEIVWIDSISYGPVPLNTTLGRINDGDPEFALLSEATPAYSNNGTPRYMMGPRIQPPGKIIEGSQEISIISPEESAEIFYTLDGSEPTMMSSLYKGPFNIDTTLQINARAFMPGYSGDISRASFILKPQGKIPILSLDLHRDDLFDDEKGIYVKGSNGVTGYCISYPANWNQDWEKQGRLTMYEPDGLNAFSVNAGIKIGGGCSRGLNMKSFNLFFRNKYGDPFIPYKIFSNSEIHNYHRIKIRNAGTDNGSMMLRDGINQLLFMGEIDIDLVNYQPSVLYLNSEFWGMYGIREFINEDYIESHYGYKTDEIDLIKSPYSWKDVKVGSDSAFIELTAYIKMHDLSVEEHFNYVADRIDINEYINYNIAQIYLANYDWPAINTYVWRPRNNGKWRWVLYDTDGSANFDLFYDTYPSYNSMRHAAEPMFETWPNSESSTLFLRKLFENNRFRDEFAQRTSTYIKLLFNPSRVDHLTDSLIALINPYADQMLEKWGKNIPELGWSQAMGGSREKWEENIALYKDFFVKRPVHIQRHIGDYFRFDGTYKLELNHNAQSHGKVYVNSNKKELPFGFSADYFKHIPLKLSAVPDEGYSFYKWEENGDTNPDIEYIGAMDAKLTPIFIPASLIENNETMDFQIYPNPTNGIINISLVEMMRTNVEMMVYNSFGQIVRQESFNRESGKERLIIDLTGLSNGIYSVKVGNEKGFRVKQVVLIGNE